MKTTTRTIALGGVAAMLAAAPALADRDPTAEERTAIEEALTGHGFTSWDEIEYDDDEHWEVDDAVGADGKQYDLHLAPETFEIIKQEED